MIHAMYKNLCKQARNSLYGAVTLADLPEDRPRIVTAKIGGVFIALCSRSAHTISIQSRNYRTTTPLFGARVPIESVQVRKQRSIKRAMKMELLC